MKPIVNGKRIFVTGGSGFIGSYLVENLLNTNKILCFDNSFRGSNLEYLEKKYTEKFRKNITVVNGDIRKIESISKAVKDFKPEIVFHLAGVAGVQTVIKRPLETIEVNLNGTYNLISSILKSSVKQVIYTSTSEVYGSAAYQLSENNNTMQGSPYIPRWSYATSKLMAEHILVAMEREYGIPVSICRLFNIYGPRQIGEGAIHNFVVRALSNKPLEIYGTGTEIRAWCHIMDCLNGISIVTKHGSGIYNIGHPYEGLTSYALALRIKELTKSNSKIKFKEPSYADISVRVPNISKIEKLGFKPKMSLSEGLLHTINWYKKNK